MAGEDRAAEAPARLTKRGTRIIITRGIGEVAHAAISQLNLINNIFRTYIVQANYIICNLSISYICDL